MADIVLATLNARYAHTAFGLRYLLANLGELRNRTRLLEFQLQDRPMDVVERILAETPKLVGLGVYIWNVNLSTEVARLLKRLAPEVHLVLGGPEVSYESEGQPIVQVADHVIPGEADLAFAALCRRILAGDPPREKIVSVPLPDLAQLTLPYHLYSDDDLRHRTVYVEASRGCPFSCEFCLSSLDIPVRRFPLEPWLREMQHLLDRGLEQFKFVDRTFNLNTRSTETILQFFLQRWRPGLFLHFELIPDHLPESLRTLVRQFPPGALQFEIGIQTFNPEVAERIRRRQDYDRTLENLRFLREETGVHLHVDLIAGLPGESLASFAEGFDRLVALQPQEIQVGILKRLRGTSIGRHDGEWGMVYSPTAPYEILRTSTLDFPALQRLRRFSRFWDLVSNSGNFVATFPLLWADGASPFARFLAWSDWAYAQAGRQHALALDRLAHLLYRHLTEVRQLGPPTVSAALRADFDRTGREPPEFLRGTSSATPGTHRAAPAVRSHRRRQERHQGSLGP